jgi:hypothetical protein
MEWIIGAIVVWILWRLITGKPRREATLQDAISSAFISNQHGQEWIKTPIYWDAADKFALDKGARLINGSYHFQMQLNSEEVAVIFYHAVTRGTLNISVRKVADLADEAKKYADEIISLGNKAMIERVIKSAIDKNNAIESSINWHDAVVFTKGYSCEQGPDSIRFFWPIDAEDDFSKEHFVYFIRNPANDKTKVSVQP